MTDTFQRNLMISVIGHLALVLIIFFRAVMIPSEAIEIRRAIRVDVVDLPAKMTEMPAPTPTPAAPAIKDLPPKEEPKAAKPEPVKTPAKPKEKKIDLSKSQKKALDQIKAMAALDKIQNEVNEKKSQEKAQEKAEKPAQQIKGNQVSAGNSLTGLDKIEFDRYFDDLHAKILEQWSIPQWLADAPLKAQVQILIDEKGFITKKIMRRSSGNAIFDGKVIEAIEASSPLPPPPRRLQGTLSTSGIILNFPE